MKGIFYFSSTGNSLFIAKKVQERLGGEIKYIPNYTGDASEFESLIIVTPIYSFGIPVHVLNFLGRINKTIEIIVIQNYGGMVGGADRLFYEYATNKFNLNVVSMFKLKMPENFTLVMSPSKFYIKSILKSATKRINKILNAIQNNQYVLSKPKRTHEQTYLKNKSNWHKIGEEFSVNEKCIKCGKCVALCPAHNICFKDGNISFGNQCVACLGCFHRCPQKAIIYKHKDNKKRYINPKINEPDIGKDF